MNIQNETIRINFDIDDRAIRQLDDIISDLNKTLGDIGDALGNLELSSSNSLGTFAMLAGAFAVLSFDGDALKGSLTELTKKSLKGLSGELATAQGNVVGLLGAFKNTAGTIVKKKGALGLLVGAMKLIPWAGAIWGLTQLPGLFRSVISSAIGCREEYERLTDAIGANRAAHATRRGEIERELTTNRSLISHLQELQNAEHRTNGARGVAILKTRELNELMPDLNLAYDRQTGLLDENSERTLTLAGYYADLSAATDSLQNDQDRLNEITEEYPDITDRLTDLRQIMAENNETIRDTTTGIYSHSAAFYRARDEYQALIVQQQRLGNESEYLTDRIYNTAGEMMGIYDTLAIHHSMTFDTMTDSQQAVVDGFRDMHSLSAGYLNDLTGTFEHNNDLTWASAQLNNRRMITETAMFTNLYSDLVSQGVSEAFLQAIGADSASAIPMLVEMQRYGVQNVINEQDRWYAAHAANADTMLDAFEINGEHRTAIRNYVLGLENSLSDNIEASNFRELGRTSSRQFMGALNEEAQVQAEMLRHNSYLYGGQFVEGTANGIMGRVREAVNSMSHVSEAMQRAFRMLNGLSSPSRVYRSYGENIIQGLVNGLEALRAQPIRSIQTLARDMERIYNTANRDYINIGRDIMRGLNQGLLNGEAQVMNTARRIANQITQAMRQALNINSPSRVMQEEIGRQIPAGVAEGIDKYGSYATDSMYDLGNELAKVRFPSINDIINMGPSLSLAGAGASSMITNHNNNQSHSYAGLFDGATINWHGEEDIRRTMEKMARAAEEDSYRMW